MLSHFTHAYFGWEKIMSVTQSISFRLVMTNHEKLEIFKNQVRAFGFRRVKATISISEKEVDE